MTYPQLPAGIIVAFAGKNPPSGWLLCDGSYLDSRDPLYNKLHAAIGTIHGGDDAPNFQLPDYRGMFLRGVTGLSANDPDAAQRSPPGNPANAGTTGNNVGSIQASQIGIHRHTTHGFTLEASSGTGFLGVGFRSNSGNHGWDGDFPTSDAGGQETRPINAYVNYIISLG